MPAVNKGKSPEQRGPSSFIRTVTSRPEMSKGMWRPGEPRPKSPQQTPPPTRTTGSNNKRSLSSATSRMRFMQRGTPAQEETSPMDTSEPIEDDKKGMDDTSQSHIATNLEMYGTERAKLVGRRSFGGFNKTVAELHYNQVRYELHSKHKHRLSDQELVARTANKKYEDNNQSSDGKKKKRRPQSISNTTKRKRSL